MLKKLKFNSIEEKQKFIDKVLGMIAIAFLSSVVFGIPYVQYSYYNPMMKAMNATHTQMGLLLTSYGTGCMISYLPGGILGDKFRTRKVIIVSQLCTAALGFYLAFTLSYKVAVVAWFLFAFTTCFALWCSMGKAKRMLVGTEDGLGGMGYGMLALVEAILGIIVGSSYVFIFAQFGSSNEVLGFKWVIIAMSIAQVIATLLVFFLFKEDKFDPVIEDENDRFKAKDTITVLKMPSVWLLSCVCLSTWAIAGGGSYFTPYLNDIFGISTVETAALVIFRKGLFLLAPVGGFLLDRVFKSMARFYVYLISGLGLSFVIMMIVPEGVSPLAATLITLIPAVIRGITGGLADTVFNEAKLPLKYTGTAYAVSSLICYLPDLFLYTLCGHFLDTHPGKTGYIMIFALMVGFAIFGVVSAILLKISINKHNKELAETSVN